MYNAPQPRDEDLPSRARLNRATVIAVVAALIISVTIVLPAERGLDPTGVGRVLGLTQMGEIRQQLIEEAAEDEHHGGAGLLDRFVGFFIGTASAEGSWRDTVTLTLEPNAAAEVKMEMVQGSVATFRWQATGGRINFDLHGHGQVNGDRQSETYEKGRGATDGEGEITAAFDGEHGWFWRNRDAQPVVLEISVGGDYANLSVSQK